MNRRTFLGSLVAAPLGVVMTQSLTPKATNGVFTPAQMRALSPADMILPADQTHRIVLHLHGVSYDEADIGRAVAASLAKGSMGTTG